MSTFTPPFASAAKSRDAVMFSTQYSVSSSVCVTPEIIAFSSMRSSSSITQVPAAGLKLDRTCSLTPWLRANSTDRSCRTLAPDAAISSISS